MKGPKCSSTLYTQLLNGGTSIPKKSHTTEIRRSHGTGRNFQLCCLCPLTVTSLGPGVSLLSDGKTIPGSHFLSWYNFLNTWDRVQSVNKHIYRRLQSRSFMSNCQSLWYINGTIISSKPCFAFSSLCSLKKSHRQAFGSACHIMFYNGGHLSVLWFYCNVCRRYDNICATVSSTLIMWHNTTSVLLILFKIFQVEAWNQSEPNCARVCQKIRQNISLFLTGHRVFGQLYPKHIVEPLPTLQRYCFHCLVAAFQRGGKTVPRRRTPLLHRLLASCQEHSSDHPTGNLCEWFIFVSRCCILIVAMMHNAIQVQYSKSSFFSSFETWNTGSIHETQSSSPQSSFCRSCLYDQSNETLFHCFHLLITRWRLP